MKAAVLLSGGVDSSVALALAREQGWELSAFYIKIWLEDELAYLGHCPWEEDLGFARAVCEKLGVPLEVVSLQQDYLEKVVDQTLAELRGGLTPSPDILCNQRIKFGVFLERIAPGFDKIVSGHYARVAHPTGGLSILKRAADSIKDQTYFLSFLAQTQVARCLFPVGDLLKREVRALAQAHGLATAQRKDSQGLCFLGRIKYREFVKFHLGERAGPIVERKTGHVLGQHRGPWFYTIGQRKGLDLSGGPWFVIAKNLEENTVFVGHERDLAMGSRDEFNAASLHWIAGPPTAHALEVKLRHSPELAPCRIEEAGPGQLRVLLDRADPGIAPGQVAVFYEGENCLGGGVIE